MTTYIMNVYQSYRIYIRVYSYIPNDQLNMIEISVVHKILLIAQPIQRAYNRRDLIIILGIISKRERKLEHKRF